VLDDGASNCAWPNPSAADYGESPTTMCFIMPERVAKTDPFSRSTRSSAAGRFVFVRNEWVAGSRAVYPVHRYTRAPRHPASPPVAKIVHFDRIEWQVMPDAATAGAHCRRRGRLARATADRPAAADAPQQGACGSNERSIFGVIGVIVFNHLQPPFDNVKLRRALLPAVDQGEFVAAVMAARAPPRRTGVGVFTADSPLANTVVSTRLTGPRDIAARAGAW